MPGEREHAGQREHDRRRGQRHPVGGHDPQRAPPRVREQRRPRLPGPARLHERAVQEEARQQEEDRHADVEPRDVRGDHVALRRPAGVEADRVEEEHGQRRDRPQRVQPRVAALPHGPDCHAGGCREGGWPWPSSEWLALRRGTSSPDGQRPGEVVAHEERVHAGQLRVDEPVALLGAERLERGERGAVAARVVPLPARRVGHHARHRGVEVAVVLDHDHARPERAERAPDPVVVAVDVDHQQVRLLGHAGAAQQPLDGVRLDGGLHGPHAGLPAVAALEGGERARVRLEEQAGPAEHLREERGVALGAVGRAELDEAAAGDPDPPEDLGQHAVLAVLGQHAQLVGGQARHGARLAPALGQLAQRRVDAARAVTGVERALGEAVDALGAHGGADAVEHRHDSTSAGGRPAATRRAPARRAGSRSTPRSSSTART